MDLLLDHARERPPTGAGPRMRLAAAAAVVARLSGLDEHRSAVLRLPGGGSALPNWAAETADAAGRTAEAIALRQAALARSEGLTELPEIFLPLASGLIDAGRWPEADALATRARAACDTADLRLLEVEIVAVEATLAGLRGDGPGARRLVESVWTRIDLHQNRRVGARLRQSLGISAFAEGDHEAAYRHHRALFGPDGTPLYPDHTGHMLLGLAVTAVRTGRAAEALRVLDASTGPDNPRRRMRQAQVRAMLTDDDTSETAFRAAVDDPAGEAWPFERALARLHYGTWLRRRRRSLDARAQLSEAVALLDRLGAEGLAEIARTELTAAGETPDAESGPLQSLSPQQRRIVLLAADGLSNNEIATHLRMSPRTVGTHLYNAYPKLGVGGRRQLNALLSNGK
jgi:DNA-binding CsgD family transcriptional regulator